ncbi:hypothetical protein K438DRAFT_739895 [Mycena galopus ATCC 62051]|nr:hypothetical protein K438DRAFT_739895 [Mycena galopus ATCC 62051]
MLSLGALIGEILLVVFSTICMNVLLFRRPEAYASELEPILEQAKACRQQAPPFLCSGSTQAPLPSSLLSLQITWERYLERKIREWSFCSYGAGILVAFVMGALQIAEKNDPLTRVFAFIAFAVLAFSLFVNQLLGYHMDGTGVKDVHYGYHLLLENLEEGKFSMWNMHSLLSLSGISTWWGLLLSICTFGAVFYHDTGTNGSSVDTNSPLSLWEMVTSRVVMVAIVLVSTACLVLMHVTLKSYGKCIKDVSSPQVTTPDNGS